jgi:hypothetical protein
LIDVATIPAHDKLIPECTIFKIDLNICLFIVCKENGCKKRPAFNNEGEIKALYCSAHKKEGIHKDKNISNISNFIKNYYPMNNIYLLFLVPLLFVFLFLFVFLLFVFLFLFVFLRPPTVCLLTISSCS